jgi:hypothetical protein
VIVGWPGATQDRLPAGSPDTRPGPADVASARAKEAELLVLRHQNAVLRRQAGRIRYEPAPRVWSAALAPPRRRWTGIFPMTPATLLARHRKLAARKARHERAAQARPPADGPGAGASPERRPDPNRSTVRLLLYFAAVLSLNPGLIFSNCAFDLWSYGDSNPRPLACHQQATRPPEFRYRRRTSRGRSGSGVAHAPSRATPVACS